MGREALRSICGRTYSWVDGDGSPFAFFGEDLETWLASLLE